MKLSQLLRQRRHLLRQVRLAHLAHAYDQLRRLAARVAAVRLEGRVRLQAIDPGVERYAPALTALTGPQSRLEEHFSDEDLVQLADAIGLALDGEFHELEFDLAELGAHFAPRLHRVLADEGVDIDAAVGETPNATVDNPGAET